MTAITEAISATPKTSSLIPASRNSKLGVSSSNKLFNNNNNEVELNSSKIDFANNYIASPDFDTLNASEIVKFYKNQNILITGASGFLGKVLLWKIIETFKDVGKIYVLLRAKNNVSADKRLIQLLKGKPFSERYEYGHLLQKVVAIESDITIDGLGLSQSDRTLLQDQVDIVFHSAASVKFDAPLKDNLRDNFNGTRYIIDLCKTMPRLKSMVHVSTAYSNCHKPSIGEELVPLENSLEDILKIIELLPDDVDESVTDKLLEGRPNTYTFTKAMAEHYVARQEGNFPICIVRPSIVINSTREPCNGWVDNVNGIAGLGCLASIGVLRSIDWNYYATSDMVPVDYVANSLICAAHHTSVNSPKKLLFYNMTSGNMAPISWGVFFEMLRNEATKAPPNKIVRPMIHSPKYVRANPIQFFFIRFFSELLFAHAIDLILSLIGYKKIMVKITQKMHHGYKILKPFTTNQWIFTSTNLIDLSDSLNETDRELFKFDMRGHDWEDQAHTTWMGARKLLLKEEPTEESVKNALQRQKLVSSIHYSFIAIFTSLLIFMSYYSAKILNLL